MYRKVSFKDGSRQRGLEDRQTGDRNVPLRLPEQKLANLREMIKLQSAADNHLLGNKDSDFRLTTAAEIASSQLHQSDIHMRRLHRPQDPIPMTSAGGNIFPDDECISPVRSRKVARKMNDGDDEENLPATPLLPGKIRVESLKQKPKRDIKAGDKSKPKAETGTLQKAASVPAKADTSKDSKKTSGLVAQALAALPLDNEGAKPKTGPSEKRIRHEADVRAYKRGLEVAWQVIGPPPASQHPSKKKSPDVAEKVKKGSKPSAVPSEPPKKAKSIAAPEEVKKTAKSSEDGDKSEEITEDVATESNVDGVDESKLPHDVRKLADDLRAALKQDDDSAKSKEAKAKTLAGRSKSADDRNKPAKEVPCVKKSRPVTDREAILSYIKQQRLARHSAEQQRRAEQARLEREKQARLQALYQHQQAVARVPVRELLPEGFAAPPRISLRLPSSIRIEEEKSASEPSIAESPMIVDKKSVSHRTADSQSFTSKRNEVVAEQSPVNVSHAVIPDANKTRRICAILESALSLQVKLRAEVDRVDRFISGRSGTQSAVIEDVTPAKVASNGIAAKPNTPADHRRSPSPYDVSSVSERSDNVGMSPLGATKQQLRNVCDTSTSPIRLSPERRDTSPLNRTLTPSKGSPSPKHVRIVTPEMPNNTSDMTQTESSQTSPLSTAPVFRVASVQHHVATGTSPFLPIRHDPWSVANVMRRSFGVGPEGRSNYPEPSHADASQQTTFMSSPPRFTSDIGVQSAMTPVAESSFSVQNTSLHRSRPDLVEACIQTASPTKLPDETAGSSGDDSNSFHRLSPRPSRVSEILKEEAETERVPVEVLDARLHAELDLLASLDGYHRQLDDLERSRISGEQNTDVAGLVSLMNAVESHVRVSLHQQQTPTARPSSPPRAKSSVQRPTSAAKQEETPIRQQQQVVYVEKLVQPAVDAQSASLTALEMRQDIERRFQALEAATGRRLAEDSERLLEAHLRTSIAVSDLTRQLADMQRASLIGIEERQANIRQQDAQHHEQQQQQQQPKYHRRQTFSPPRPPPLAPPASSQAQPTATLPVLNLSRASASTATVTSASATPRPVSELRTITASSSTRSVEESADSVSENSLGKDAEDDDESPGSPSPRPTKGAMPSPQMNTSLARRMEDHQLLCDLIAQQARQSSLRFRADIAELTLREREAKRRANTELALIDRQKKSLADTPENKAEIDRLNKLRVRILTSYAKEKKHLESLKKSSTRLASEQRTLADQLRRSLPATLNASEYPDETADLSESLATENQDHDLSMQLMQLQLGDNDPTHPKLSKNVIDQLLSGREQMLEERQAIAEQLMMRKAQLDAKEDQIRELEDRLARELATPSRQQHRPSTGVKEAKERPSLPQLQTQQQHLLVVPSVSPYHQKSTTPRGAGIVSAAGCTDDDVASLPESTSQAMTARTVPTEHVATTPGSTTAPPIPSSSIAGLGEILMLEHLSKQKHAVQQEESIAETIDSSRPATATARSTTPAATVVSEEASAVSEDIAPPVEEDYEDDYEQDKTSLIATEKTPRSITEDSVPPLPPVDTSKVTTMRDELEEKRNMVKELKAARDEIKRRREVERVRAKETALSTKLEKKNDEIRQLEAEIANLQAASETEHSIATETEAEEELRSEATPPPPPPFEMATPAVASISPIEPFTPAVPVAKAQKVDDEEENDNDFFVSVVGIPKREPPKPAEKLEPVAKSTPQQVAVTPTDQEDAKSALSESVNSARSISESVHDAKSVSESIHDAKSASESVKEAKSLSEHQKQAEVEPELELETEPETTSVDHEKTEPDDDEEDEEEEEEEEEEEDEEGAQQKAMQQLLDDEKEAEAVPSLPEPEEAEKEDEEKDESYSESFSRESSSRAKSSAKEGGVDEVAEELPEALSESVDEDVSNADLTESSASNMGGTAVFLDLGSTLPIPDSPIDAKTPLAPPPLNSTYTLSSTTGETPATPAPRGKDEPIIDVTPKLPSNTQPKGPGRIADSVADDVFPDLVKEAVDSAVFTVKTSPKKEPKSDQPERIPLPADIDMEDLVFEDDDDDDDRTFSKVAEVASRLRSIAGVSSSTAAPPKAPEIIPFLANRRQKVPKVVHDCVDYLWKARNDQLPIDTLTLPSHIAIDSETSTPSEDLTNAESQFCQLVFDTVKFLFIDVFSRGEKIVPRSIEEAHRAVFAQIAPIAGLAVPGASLSGIPQRVHFVTVGRRRDAVDEVLLSELYAEPSDVWCDFSQDETAVREEVVSSLLSGLVEDLMAELAPFFSAQNKQK